MTFEASLEECQRRMNENPNENWSALNVRVFLCWRDENKDGIWNNLPASAIEIDGIEYPVVAGEATLREDRLVCQMPTKVGDSLSGLYAVTTPDGQSIQFVKAPADAFGSWGEVRRARQIVAAL